MRRRILIYRHTGATRVTHWVNALAVTLLLMSGLQIFNAHPALYWGARSAFEAPWLAMTAAPHAGGAQGVTTLAGQSFDTTGVLGWSGGSARGFPAWATLPSWRDLSQGRRWHFFLAWIFVVNGAVYVAAGLFGGHIRRDLWPTRAELAPKHLWDEIVAHARLRFPKGEAARRYNALQKLAYVGVALVVLPLMIATGLSMSPAIDAAAPWLPEFFGGRQSARSIHFICATLIVAFVIVHLLMVVLSGLWNNLRSMVTGRYAITQDGEPS